jgi:hypothetical protein
LPPHPEGESHPTGWIGSPNTPTLLSWPLREMQVARGLSDRDGLRGSRALGRVLTSVAWRFRCQWTDPHHARDWREPASPCSSADAGVLLNQAGGCVMSTFRRRSLLKSGLASAALLKAAVSWTQSEPMPKRKGRIHQSVCRWCYPDIPLDKLCAYAAHIGLSGVDLLGPDDYQVPRRYGLVCTMALTCPAFSVPSEMRENSLEEGRSCPRRSTSRSR